MKITLKTGVTYPRGSGPRVEAGTVLDVPDETAADWIKRGIAEPATPTPAPVPIQPEPARSKTSSLPHSSHTSHSKGKK